MAQRSASAGVRGAPWPMAVLAEVVLTTGGAWLGVNREGLLGSVLMVAYVLGCLLAVGWVRRSELFAPMVGPPIVAAAVVPGVALVTGSSSTTAGMVVIAVGPLIALFPTIGLTTAGCVLFGLLRWLLQPMPARPGGQDEPRAVPQ